MDDAISIIRGGHSAAAQATAALAIERVAVAVVVMARDRKILLANPAAEDILARHRPAMVRDGRLCPRDPAQLAVLEKGLEACPNYRFDDRFSLSMRLAGAPGDGVVARLVPPPISMPKESSAAAIAFIAREGRSALNLQTMMATLYKLTPTEAALVRALSEGMTAESFAEARRVGLATVKTQLRSVFAKTGTRRQSDLMRLVYSIAH